MASDSIPVDPGAPTAAKRTRRSDRWTDVFLVLTAIFGLWAIALVVLTTAAIIKPTFLYQDQKIALKAVGATVVGLLALSQTYTMTAAMGKVPRFGIKMKYLMRSHRYGGRILLVLAVVVAFFCMTDIGAPQSPLATMLHHDLRLRPPSRRSPSSWRSSSGDRRSPTTPHRGSGATPRSRSWSSGSARSSRYYTDIL